jgi:hypothetical protein
VSVIAILFVVHMAKPGCITCLVLLGIAIIISCALLGASFDTLLPTEMALLFDGNTGQLHCDKLYGDVRTGNSKRYFVGLGEFSVVDNNSTTLCAAIPAFSCRPRYQDHA